MTLDPAPLDRAIPPFVAGDRVAWIGDSISHNGWWHRYVLAFLATRFPQQVFTVQNRGLSGDDAGGALRRFREDIATTPPTRATVMFGMNDVKRSLYGGLDSTARCQARAEALARYAANLESLVDRVVALGTAPILLTPTPYDQTTVSLTMNHVGVNDALARCRDIVMACAARRRLPVIDLHTPLTALHQRHQAVDPGFSLIGPDRVHPGEMGHLAIAYHVLRAFDIDGLVSDLAIDAAAARVDRHRHLAVSEFAATPDGCSLTVLSRSLPFPLTPGARLALALVPFAQDLDQELLTVTSLRPGFYRIRIDGRDVATVASDQLAAGVNLALLATPQHQQALEVLEHGERAFAIIARMRHAICIRHFVLSTTPDLDLADANAVDRVLADVEAARRARQDEFGLAQISHYRTLHGRMAEAQAEADAAHGAMWAAARPIPRRIEVVPVPGP